MLDSLELETKYFVAENSMFMLDVFDCFSDIFHS